MSAAGASEDPFQCSICLEVFTDPVSTPCGHNFCKRCISQAWDTGSRCFCPLCKEVFQTRPELKINTLLLGLIVTQKKQEAPKPPPKPQGVLCAFCTEPQQKAVKSCLICLTSYCETHLQNHMSLPGLMTHPLTLPMSLNNIEDRICSKHQHPLELFCNTDQLCMCSICALLEHKSHDLVSVEVACEQKKASLQSTQDQRQQLVEQRRLMIQEIQRSLELSQKEAQGEVAQLEQVFTDIMERVQKCLKNNTQVIEQAQSALKKEAQIMISELQQEMCELEKSSIEAQELSHSTDTIRFLQHFPALLPPAGLKDLTKVSFKPQKCEGRVAHALSELEHALSEKFNPVKPVLKKEPLTSKMAELRKLQQFAMDITLDSATAHSELVLSKDLKHVHHSDITQRLRLSTHRFDYCANVLGKQSISSGRVYFEVQVNGKIECDLGVALKSINRKGDIKASPSHGQWSICLRNSITYYACTDPWTPLTLQRLPQKIGVFVDYGAGLVSFYDADCGDLIFSFTNCCFREKLLPLLSPGNNHKGKNSVPLIITAVK